MLETLQQHRHDIYMSIGLGFAGGALIAMAFFAHATPHLNVLIPFSVFFSPVISVVGFISFFYLARWVPILPQLARFCIVGFVSTAIEIAVINILIALTGHASGWYFTAFKTGTFLLALLNGYFLNRFWTFQSLEERVHLEFGKYAGVNLVGIVINVSTASLLVNVIGVPQGVAAELWANIGVIAAVFVTMVWNFLSYRLFVFRSVKGIGNL